MDLINGEPALTGTAPRTTTLAEKLGSSARNLYDRGIKYLMDGSIGSLSAHQTSRKKRKRTPQQKHKWRQQSVTPRSFCDICDVTPRISAWEEHVLGSRHRRNDSSLSCFGERGHVVKPTIEPGQQYRGTQVSCTDTALSRQSSTRGPSSQKLDMEMNIASAVGKIRKELLHHVASNTYCKAADQFTERRMRRDWKRMEAELSGMGASWLLGGIGPLTPSQLVALSSLIQTRTESELAINVCLSGDEHLGASMTAALCVFFDALGSNIHLRKLTLRVGSRPYATFRQHEVDLLQAKWRFVMKRALVALSVNVVLRELKLEVPTPLVREGDAETLIAAMNAARRRQRLAILMGAHERVGADSPLRWIPLNALRSIVEMGVPKAQCAVDIRTVAVPGMDWHAGPDLFVVQQFL